MFTSYSIENITPSELVANPTALLHKRGMDDVYTAFDGRIGAVVGDGEFFITTPNQDVIWHPPLGSNHDMRPRRDLRFADDDFLLWPQPYIAECCHFGTIPQRPQASDDRSSVMWDDFPRTLFRPCTTNMVTGVGHLDGRTRDIFWGFVNSLQSRVKEYQEDQRVAHKNQYVSRLSNALNHSFSRLNSLPMTWRQIQFSISDVQWHYLELTGLLDYLLIYKPRMDGDLLPATSCAATVGAFTISPQVAQEFFRAGLPVWVLRPYSMLSAVRINSVKPAREPKDFVCVQDNYPRTPPVFIGSATSPEKYEKWGLWRRNFVKYPNPFESAILGPSPPVAHHSSTSSVSQTTKSANPSAKNRKTKTRVYPYQKPQPSGQAGSVKVARNKFAEPSGLFTPPPIAAWKDALALVNTDPRNLVYKTKPSDAGYVFPDPGLFAGVSTQEKQALYFENWLKHRMEVIYRVVSSQSSATPLSNQMWRTLLVFGTSPVQGGSTKTAERRDFISKLLGNTAMEEGIEVGGMGRSNEIFWRDQLLLPGKVPEQRIGQEILWELYELNFRFELLALDERASQSVTSKMDRQDDVLACFAGPAGSSLLVVDFTFANQGLAAESWRERLPSLLALQKLMTTWSRAPKLLVDHVTKPVGHYCESEVLALEQQICCFYTQSFFDYFGRAAILPRCLSRSHPQY